MKVYATILLLGCMFLAFPQQPKTYFDSQIARHLKAYNVKSEIAMLNGDKEQAKFLFDSLFENHLKDSYIRDISLNKVKGGTLKTASIDNPFLLITKSSWEIIKDEEIAEINRMSKLYKGQLEIIILFWDSKDKAKQLSKNYNSNVTVTYIDERKNKASHIIKPFKHSFGAPACFYFSEEKQLLKIDKKFTISNVDHTAEVAFDAIHEKIKRILFGDEPDKNGIITTL
ncbi:hypothetical protein [Psychroserpens damuponensis]|uniref:hypothetical protein n=1 Tax=Psychroserpens damuponensis TaxID=943936 RepID=UPI00059120A9|nr:hypothetical protein [Psychroserpens damuponensis]